MQSISKLADLIAAGAVPATWKPRRAMPKMPAYWREDQLANDIDYALDLVIDRGASGVVFPIKDTYVRVCQHAFHFSLIQHDGSTRMIELSLARTRLTKRECKERICGWAEAQVYELIKAGCECPLAAAIRAIARLPLGQALSAIVVKGSVVDAVSALLAADTTLLHRDALRLLSNPSLLETPMGRDLLHRGLLITALLNHQDKRFLDADELRGRCSSWKDLLTTNLAGTPGKVGHRSQVVLDRLCDHDVSPFDRSQQGEREITAEIDRLMTEKIVVVAAPKPQPLTREQVTARVALLIAQDPLAFPDHLLGPWAHQATDQPVPKLTLAQLDTHGQRRYACWQQLLNTVDVLGAPSDELRRLIAEVIQHDATEALVDGRRVDPRFDQLLGRQPRKEGFTLVTILDRLFVERAKVAKRRSQAAA